MTDEEFITKLDHSPEANFSAPVVHELIVRLRSRNDQLKRTEEHCDRAMAVADAALKSWDGLLQTVTRVTSGLGN